MGAAPLYSLGQSVYLKESAAVGFLETYKVGRILLNPQNNAWCYGFEITSRPPTAIPTVTDQVNLNYSGRHLYFDESELVTYCTALQLAQTYMQAQANNLAAKISAMNCQ